MKSLEGDGEKNRLKLGEDRFAASSRYNLSFWTIDSAGLRQGAIRVDLSLSGVLPVLGRHARFWLRAEDR